jgi:hypothetical protein
MWAGFVLEWTHGSTTYTIHVSNPEKRSGGVGLATLDGVPVDSQAIPLIDDGQQHTVDVVLAKMASVDRVAPGYSRAADPPRLLSATVPVRPRKRSIKTV